MDKLQRRLNKITGDILGKPFDPTSEEGVRITTEMKALQELSKTLRLYEGMTTVLPDGKMKERLDLLTGAMLKESKPNAETSETYIEELKTLQMLVKTWDSFDGIEVRDDEDVRDRKSTKTWDAPDSEFTTKLRYPDKLTERQLEAMDLLDDFVHDMLLLLGGSGSGKSVVGAYKIVCDALRYKAPCLIARDKLIDLRQGMIDQTIPMILQLIANANGQPDWRTWTIDGLKFAKWSDKKSLLEFATGGYVRFAGLSARDLSESGSDKILSPSWLHIMIEEVSEDDYEIVEMLLTRLRFNVKGVLNKCIMCENPPSINHWSYKRFFEFKREDGTELSMDEIGQHAHLLMNPQDNVENLSENYIRNLSNMSGANRERFYLGQFQDTETGEVFKRINWTDNLPRACDWEKLIIYTDPTPLTGKEYSKWADYKATVLCGLFDGVTYVLDVRIVKGSTEQMLTNMKQLWDISPNQSITDVVMEKKQVPSDFNQVLATFSVKTGWVCPLQYDKRQFGDKKATIETFLQPLFENDLIEFNKAFRDTERGRETQVQILKFSRKANKMIHDDIPDAIMRADTFMKGKHGKRKRNSSNNIVVGFVTPAYVHNAH